MQISANKPIIMPQPAAPARRAPAPTSIFTSAPAEDRVSLNPSPGQAAPAADGPNKGPGPGGYPKAKWTVLNYCAADNNLYAYIYDDAASMEKIGSTGSVQLVTQFDHQGNGAYRFRVEKDAETGPEAERHIDSPVLQSLGPVNMSDPKTLSDFISWGIKTFPAEHYMLVIADHGKGWEGLIQDDSHKGWMSVPQLRQALETAQKETGQKLDVLGFDACQMAAVEVASEIKDYARFMVASQALEGREGWPYSHILGQGQLADIHQAHLFKSDVEARQVVELVVQSAAENQNVLPTMAGFDLSKMADLEKSLKKFSVELTASGLSGSLMRQLRSKTQTFGFVYDLGDFLKRTAASAATQNQLNLKKVADECLEQLNQVIIAEHHNEQNPGATGLSVELKQTKAPYDQLAFVGATDWKQTVDRFNQA
ncbi:MAG: clostripain-related cysteine peptidase [Vulcanimicrobiota bacterium]